MIPLGIGINKRRKAKLESELIVYMDGLITPLSHSQQSNLNTLIKNLKSGLDIENLSDAFDTFYVLAGETQESSLRNLVKDAHYAAIVDGAPAWAEFEGFTGDTSAKPSIRTNYTAATQAVTYAQNSASSGVYTRKDGVGGIVCGFANSSTNGVFMQVATNGLVAINNTHAGSNIGTVVDRRGLFIASRILSTEYKVLRNKDLISTLTINSSVISNAEDYILCYNENGILASHSSQQLSMRFLGKGFTEVEIGVINDAFEVYMSAVGKSVLLVNNPILVFSFDDGYEDNYTILNDVMIAKNKKWTLYLATDYTSIYTLLTPAQVTEMIADGVDVQCHTSTHPDLTTLTESQVLEQYDLVDAFFAEQGWAAPIHTAYPGGSESANVRSWTATKRTTGRLVNGLDFIETVSLMQISSLSINIDKDDSAALNSVKARMDTMAANKTFLTFFGHKVYQDADPDPFEGNSTQISYVEELLDYADTLEIRVLTMSELYDFMQQISVTV